MGDAVSAVVGAITNGIKWVRAQYRKFKVWLASELVEALNKGWKAALTIVGLVAASIAVGYVWQIMKQNAIVAAVKSFIDTAAATAKRLAAALQLDLVIAVVNLAVLLNEKLYSQLAPLYDELGNFAEELELDFSYISSFIEVDRAILQSAYSLTGAGFLEGSAQFATGLTTWLGRLRERMMKYAEDPQKIFTDLQAEIVAERIKTANDELSKVWTAINYAGDWVRGKGEILLELVDDIDEQIGNMPDAIQEAIRPWWKDAVDKVDAFRKETWAPFWARYQDFADSVNDTFLAYGMDIAEMKRRIDDPVDWIRSLLALPEEEQATLKDTVDDFLARLLPVEEKEGEGSARAAAQAMQNTEDALEDLAAAVDALGAPGARLGLPKIPELSFEGPWYERED